MVGAGCTSGHSTSSSPMTRLYCRWCPGHPTSSSTVGIINATNGVAVRCSRRGGSSAARCGAACAACVAGRTCCMLPVPIVVPAVPPVSLVVPAVVSACSTAMVVVSPAVAACGPPVVVPPVVPLPGAGVGYADVIAVQSWPFNYGRTRRYVGACEVTL